MASTRLNRLALLLAALASALLSVAAAQVPTRVRGPISLSDIRPGDFLAFTSNRRPDGTLAAYEVRGFPKPLNPGHRPFDGRDDQTMTNATVGAMVQAAPGRELTMTYDGGAQKIVVPPGAAIFDLVLDARAQLVPGAPVNLTMDGSHVALRIQVGPTP